MTKTRKLFWSLNKEIYTYCRKQDIGEPCRYKGRKDT